jgi:hypothetical protein
MCSLGNLENFQSPFESTTSHPGKIALAFYSGLYSFSGWRINSHNFFIKSIFYLINFFRMELFKLCCRGNQEPAKGFAPFNIYR